MNFSEALEAMKAGKKVRRSDMFPDEYLTFQLSLGSGKPLHTEPQRMKTGSDRWTYHRFSVKEMEADNWEIVPEAPEVNSDKVLSEFRTWLTKAISDSHRMSPYEYLYLVRCLDKLDELSSSKPARVRTPEKCTISIDGDEGIVTTESGESIIVHIL